MRRRENRHFLCERLGVVLRISASMKSCVVPLMKILFARSSLFSSLRVGGAPCNLVNCSKSYLKGFSKTLWFRSSVNFNSISVEDLLLSFLTSWARRSFFKGIGMAAL